MADSIETKRADPDEDDEDAILREVSLLAGKKRNAEEERRYEELKPALRKMFPETPEEAEMKVKIIALEKRFSGKRADTPRHDSPLENRQYWGKPRDSGDYFQVSSIEGGWWYLNWRHRYGDQRQAKEEKFCGERSLAENIERLESEHLSFEDMKTPLLLRKLLLRMGGGRRTQGERRT